MHKRAVAFGQDEPDGEDSYYTMGRHDDFSEVGPTPGNATSVYPAISSSDGGPNLSIRALREERSE